MPDGSVVLVEIHGQRLIRIDRAGRKTTIADLPGGPNGAAVGPDGAFYICNNGGAFEYILRDGLLWPGPETSSGYTGGSIQRVDPQTGGVETVFEEYAGQRLLAPNDIVFDRHGGMWFTDIGLKSGNIRQLGAIYYGTADGSRLVRSRKHLLTPNGIGLSPAEDILYVADTLVARLYACPIQGPGILAKSNEVPGPMVANLSGHQGFDSLAVQADGNVCVATLFNGGITIVDPGQKSILGHVPFPDAATTNICFGGPDMRDAWVTCSSTGRLYKCRWPQPGHKLNFI